MMEPARFPAPASPPPEQLIGAGVVVGGGERSNEKPLYTPRGTLRRDASVKISSSNHVETGASGGREQLCYVRHKSSAHPLDPRVRRRRGLAHFFKFQRSDSSSSPDRGEPVKKQQELPIRTFASASSSFDSNRGIGLRPTQSKDELAHWSIVANKSKHDLNMKEDDVQYRLVAGHRRKDPIHIQMLSFIGLSVSTTHQDMAERTCGCFGIEQNNILSNYLHWTFRTSFWRLFLMQSVFFYGFILLFSFGIQLFGTSYPKCVIIGGSFFGENNTGFADAFALSWTTFTTVGYGLVYSGISVAYPNEPGCHAMSMLTSLEAFVGVLYAAFCGAILFSKITRIQGYAQVTFSEPMVVRYGDGILATDDDESSVNMNTPRFDPDKTPKKCGGHALPEIVETAVKKQHIPCPVLEFRILNNLHSRLGGEIMDSSLNIVASIDAANACPTILALNRQSKGRKKKKGGRRRTNRSSLQKMGSILKRQSILNNTLPMDSNASIASTDSFVSNGNSIDFDGHDVENILGHPTRNQALDEDPDNNMTPTIVLARLEVESPDHPFFKREWRVRHLIDEHSPLLTASARMAVRRNNGFWPEELNSWEGVRSSIHFNEILVSLSGTSNVNASAVYSQKVYDYRFLNVGYQFANVLYRDPSDGSLKVDMTITNDVMEQNGAGGEPLDSDYTNWFPDFSL